MKTDALFYRLFQELPACYFEAIGAGADGVEHRKLIELIEIVVSGHFPRMGRKELERMLQIKDFRETKDYQEALEEGIEQGREQTREEIALRLLKKKHPAQEVAELSGLSLRQVQSLRKKSGIQSKPQGSTS